MENTNPTGSESLDVNQAASAFEGLMGDSEEADNSQAEGQTEELQETDEVEYSEEDEQPKPRYKVKASGEEVEVELDELIKGYQQGTDYTKKSGFS